MLRELYRADKQLAIEVQRQINAKVDEECRKHNWYREEVEQQLELWRKRTAKRQTSKRD
jgi:hypothetical protein